MVRSGITLHRRLKLRHLHLLDMLNTTRSMRQTASRLGISPAAVSKSCIEIGAILGKRLFDRVQGHLVPLPGLERVLVAARRIDHELQALSEDFTRETALLHGTLRIGFQAPMLERPLVSWVARMKQEQPFLTISIELACANVFWTICMRAEMTSSRSICWMWRRQAGLRRERFVLSIA